jgi:hypothetical protein
MLLLLVRRPDAGQIGEGARKTYHAFTIPLNPTLAL